MKYNILLIFILLLILIIYQIKYDENFTLSLGKYIKFMKKNKSHHTLEEEDINMIKKIQKCYVNGNTYYDCINRLGLPYREKLKPNKRFKKHINYLKYKDVSHLLPVKKT